MSTNHQLKKCLFDFLSNRAFSGYEFKDLRALFISDYPEFSAKKYYGKIYQLVRDLANLGYIAMDSSTCTYKYSSQYLKNELLGLIDNEITAVKAQLISEHTQVVDSLSSLKYELCIYKGYLKKFPALQCLINEQISKTESQVKMLSSELNVLEKLLKA
jgi:hypothetical protein